MTKMTTWMAIACYIHDEIENLQLSLDSLASRAGATHANTFAFISRLPWHGAPGDWQSAASTAEALGATVVLGDWPSEQAQRQAAIDHLLTHPKNSGLDHTDMLVDPDGGVATFVYDTLNRVSSSETPNGSLTSFQYDAASQRTTLLLASGAKRHYMYDASGQLTTQIELDSSAAPVVTIIDMYDPVGNRIGHNVNGAATSWSYDAGDRLTTQILSGLNATFVYDAAGNTLLKWQQGTSPMTFAYDAANRITTMLQGSVLTTYAYDATGNLTGEIGGGTATTNVYDNENRLVQVQQATSPAPTLPALTNAGFETPSLGSGLYAYQYNPTGSGVGWTFSGDSGVSGNASGFTHGNPNAPEGAQIGFLQMTGSITQSFTLTGAAIVQVSFYAAQRDSASDGIAPVPNEQTFTVSIGGTVVGTFTPANGTYQSLTTTPISLAAGTYALTFTGLNPLGSDNTAFLDEVTIDVGVLVSAYSYDGDGMRRSAQEPSAAGPTTFIWDGSDYLGEY